MDLIIMEKLKIRNEILKIYNALFREDLTYEDIMNLYIRYIKLSIKLEKGKPSFLPSPDGFKYGNCYTYAMGIKCPKDFWELCYSFGKEINFCVGFINNWQKDLRCFRENELLDYFYQDCANLKIRVYNGEKLLMHGGYRIFIYVDKYMEEQQKYDFHFVRENKWGILSHKNGYNDEIERLLSLEQIDNSLRLIKTLEIVR